MFLLRSNAAIQAVFIYFEDCNAPTQLLQCTQGLTTIASLQRHSNEHESFVKKRADQALSLSVSLYVIKADAATHLQKGKHMSRWEWNWNEMNSTQITHQLNYHFFPMTTCSRASPKLPVQSIATESKPLKSHYPIERPNFQLQLLVHIFTQSFIHSQTQFLLSLPRWPQHIKFREDWMSSTLETPEECQTPGWQGFMKLQHPAATSSCSPSSTAAAAKWREETKKFTLTLTLITGSKEKASGQHLSTCLAALNYCLRLLQALGPALLRCETY